MLRGKELVALLGLLVFLDGHQIDRPHLVNLLLQNFHLLLHGIPIGGGPRLGHLLRRQGFHLRLAFIGMRDGDAFAADILEVEVIFLLHFLPQVLDGHVLLRQFHVERAALILQFRQAAALRTQRLVATGNLAFLRILQSDGLGRLRTDQLALML